MPKSLNAHEEAFYQADDHALAGSLLVDKMCSRYPVHTLFGERPEMVYVVLALDCVSTVSVFIVHLT